MTKDLAMLWQGETEAEAMTSRAFLEAVACRLEKELNANG